MDRRQLKTRQAIFNAFGTLLQKKRYENITVQEIIDEANVGRSTFYAHFETKDDLLKIMCTDIFNHVFGGTNDDGMPCDFTDSNTNLQTKLFHILWHLKNNKTNAANIFLSDSGELFLGYFKQSLNEMFKGYIEDTSAGVPQDFLLNHLSGSFAEAVKWWVKNKMETPPEKVTEYFINVVKI